MLKLKKLGFFVLYSLLLFSMLFISLELLHGNEKRPNYYDEFAQKTELRLNGRPIDFKDFSHLPNISLHFKDEVEFITTLPKLEMYEPTVICHLSYASIEVFLDGESIYTHGISDGKLHTSVGSGHHTIPLPANFENKELRIRITSLDDYKLSYLLRNIFMADAHNIIIPIIRANLFSFGTSVALTLFGISLMAVFLVLFLFGLDFRGLVYLSLLSFCIGLWGLSNMHFIRIFNDHLLTNNYMRYFSLYLNLFPWICMISDLKKESGFDRYFTALKTLHLTFVSVVIFLDLVGMVDYKSFFLPYNAILVLTTISSLLIMGRQFQKQPIYEKFLFLGNLISVSYLFIQLVLYNISKYFSLTIKGSPEALYTSFLIMIATFCIAYMMRFANTIAGKKEVEILHKLAYTDPLTGLENRQSGLSKLKEYDSCHTDYHIVILDLNHLKSVNDTYGHIRGDRMINDFAACMSHVFPDDISKSRLGGDEFMVIVPTKDLHIVNSLISKLQHEINRTNQLSDDGVQLEASYGISSTVELSCFNHEKIMHAADSKMYERKKQMKSLQSHHK